MSEEEVIVAIAGMMTSIVIILGIPLVIVHARKLWKRDSVASTTSHETDQRLERMEHAIDAIAVEVERMSEGQRYVTKLLSDRGQERVGIRAPQSRHEA